jgi:tetratricopeptide (TPR) repeat protein
MNEERDHLYNYSDSIDIVRRFEDMVKRNKQYYFDVHEFEEIIDYYLDTSKFNKASEAAYFAAKLHPSSLTIQFKLAQVLVDKKQPEKALDIIQKIEVVESSNSEFLVLKGTALNMLGDNEDAKNTFNQAIDAAFENKDDVLLSIAISYEQKDEYEIAIEYLQEAEKICSDNQSVIYEMAFCYDKLELLVQSEEYYQKYLDLDPFSDSAWFNLGLVYSKMDNNEKAIEAYDFALTINEKYASAYFNKANVLANSCEYLKAIDVYKDYCVLDENNPQVFSYIGECYEKLKDCSNSLFYYNRAIEIDKGFSDAWYGIAMVYYLEDKYEETLCNLKKALEIDGENTEYLFSLGNVYEKLKQNLQAIVAYKELTGIDPQDIEAWISWAEILFNGNNVNDAIDVLLKAYAFNNDSAYLDYRIAAYYFFNSDNTNGIDFLKKGLELDTAFYKEAFKYNPKTLFIDEVKQLIDTYKDNPAKGVASSFTSTN